MEESTSGTYLEDFLLNLEHVPTEVRGNFDLIRELDREVLEMQKELKSMQSSYINHLLKSKGVDFGSKAGGGLSSSNSSSSNSSSSSSNNMKSSFNSNNNSNNSNIFASISNQDNIGMDIDSSRNTSNNVSRSPTPSIIPNPNYGLRETASTTTAAAVAAAIAAHVVTLADIDALSTRINERLTYKTVIVQKMSEDIDNVTKKLDSDLAFFETELKGCGEFDNIKGIPPGTEVAFRVPQSNDGEDMGIILGRVIFYHAELAVYDLADSDDSKRYTIQENNVYMLNMVESIRKLNKGELVFAVFPETTSFYLAVFTQITPLPKKKNTTGGANNSSAGASGGAGGGSSSSNSSNGGGDVVNNVPTEPSVMVQFHGDADENGVVASRMVPIRYVIRPPAN